LGILARAIGIKARVKSIQEPMEIKKGEVVVKTQFAQKVLLNKVAERGNY
jgi:hypothetical protein